MVQLQPIIYRARQMFDKMKVGTGQHFLEGVDDTPHREVELQVPHQTVHFALQTAKNRIADTLMRS
jgi:hypothetical protein